MDSIGAIKREIHANYTPQSDAARIAGLLSNIQDRELLDFLHAFVPELDGDPMIAAQLSGVILHGAKLTTRSTLDTSLEEIVLSCRHANADQALAVGVILSEKVSNATRKSVQRILVREGSDSAVMFDG